MKIRSTNKPRQKIFQLEPIVLSSIDRVQAQRAQNVFDQAMFSRLYTLTPMLPSRPPQGWRSAKGLDERRDIQNTYQTAALAFDMGIPRCDIAGMARNFDHFQIIAREAVRLFDIRIGPPWWINDREFLEAAYTAIMAQEEPADKETMEHLSCYVGDDGPPWPQWQAESFFDHSNACEGDIVHCCWMNYYQQPPWIEAEQRYAWPRRSRLKAGVSRIEAEASMLLNWQVMHQPDFTLNYQDEQDSYRARTSYPHRAEERRLMRILNTLPRGRPQRQPCN